MSSHLKPNAALLLGGGSPGFSVPEPEPVSSAGQKMAMPSPLKSPAMESVKIHDLIRIGSLDELVTSFVFTTDPEHTDLVTEPEEVVTRSVQVSAAIQMAASRGCTPFCIAKRRCVHILTDFSIIQIRRIRRRLSGPRSLRATRKFLLL